MQQIGSLKWLFLDLNSYFASVEQQENPALRGKPVAVVPMDTPHTCAIAASYEAKAYGVKTGTIIRDAKKMCPALRCVLARHNVYVDYHHRILDEVIKHVPINKVWSVDELSSRLPPRFHDNEDEIAKTVRKLKDGVARNVGEAIKFSVGIAPNSFLAKVATDMQKPDGFVILRPDDLPGPLFDLKLTDFPGINVNMLRRLNNAGVHSVEDLWNVSPKHARKIWGSVSGEKFWYNLRGFEIPEQQTKTSMLGHSRVLDPELRKPAPARLVARRLTIKAATRLRRQDFYATRFCLSARILDGPKWSAELQTSPSQDNFTFLNMLDDLWAAMIAGYNPHKLKKIAVTFHGLCKSGEITPDLFDASSQSYEKLQKKNDAISNAMDSLNRKYGAETVNVGVSPQTRAGYVGTKIAFSRIPDREEFYE